MTIFAVYFKRPRDVWTWKLDAQRKTVAEYEANASRLSRLGFDTAVHDDVGRLVFERKAGA
jgi:hypothetical protein